MSKALSPAKREANELMIDLAANKPPLVPAVTSLPVGATYESMVKDFERVLWVAVMNDCGGNILKAAKRLGISASTGYRLHDKLGLSSGTKHNKVRNRIQESVMVS